jgi:pectate lyase
MKTQTKNFRKLAFIGFILGAIIMFDSCKKNAESIIPTTPGEMAVSGVTMDNNLATTSTTTVYTVSLSGLKADGGYAYKLGYSLPQSGDSNTSKTASTLRLFENGVELSPAHSVHQDIRSKGKGRFSHWGTALYFSASDNTNPATNGRKYTYTMGGTPTTDGTGTGTGTGSTGTGSGTTTTTGVSSALMGYAMVNGTTTGGAGGQTVTVSTLADLKAAVSGSTPKIIYINGRILGSGNDAVYVSSNKTILGKPGAIIEGAPLFLMQVSNIIIQNITFRNYVTDAGVMIKYASTHIWIDHCDFGTDRSHGWSYWGKDISITRASDYVTISWSKFHDNNLSVLISGGIEGNTEDIGRLHVTMHHNFWYNVSEREPDMNYGSVHVFNNYHLNNSGYSIGTRAAGNVRTDNEYFQNCLRPLSTNLAGDPPGYFSGVTTNIYSSCGANDITTPISSWLPGYSYSAVLDPAANVPAIVQKGSGAILTN